jgi:hypothetical protein
VAIDRARDMIERLDERAGWNNDLHPVTLRRESIPPARRK